MATASGNRTTRGRKTTSKGRTSKGVTRSTGTRTTNKRKKTQRNQVDSAVTNEVMLIIIFAAAIFVFLCNINVVGGDFGQFIKSVMFGIFGLLAYIIPVIVFIGFSFGISNKGNTIATLKLVAAIVLLFLIGMTSCLLSGQLSLVEANHPISSLYYNSNNGILSGGGVLFGGIAYFIQSHLGMGGTIFFVLVFAIISIIILTEKSLLDGIRHGGMTVYENASKGVERRRERRAERLEYEDVFEEEYDAVPESEDTIPEPPKPKRRVEKKARGVAPLQEIVPEAAVSKEIDFKDDIHEIVWKEEDVSITDDAGPAIANASPIKIKDEHQLDFEKINIRMMRHDPILDAVDTQYDTDSNSDASQYAIPSNVASQQSDDMQQEFDLLQHSDLQQSVDLHHDIDLQQNGNMHEITGAYGFHETHYDDTPKPVAETPAKTRKTTTAAQRNEVAQESQAIAETIQKADTVVKRKYQIPPLSLLKRGNTSAKGDSEQLLKETALRLQQTLNTFGVRVTITDISQGPAVTRYELQPEQGVKVSKIVGLADDIKLNLAATDIRIEAPIPGKAAVGIEVPNKENSAVAFRDLIESKEFREFPSNIAFAVGKDIGGQTVVTDIAKMPHLLIAGATGSGKSVCINTIIMGILYKAMPEDVQMIMIDPKVVELSVYNGIPHLMIPVVTDPKKAAAALQWGVSEMTERYKRFADMNVRDLKGYNKAVEGGKVLDENGEPIKKMPQIVIIVDELADLMMVASNDVEESICRLAQLARAAGIHLIIATQRPSVDVITGLIKANMPSRIAFSVSSGVDSRTILDMNGAEKLLGKGDMLFYPQGYAKPARVQGAFISDSEVSDIVDYIKNQELGNTYVDKDKVQEQIATIHSGSGNSSNVGGRDELDSYFADAGRFVIEKDKASIGMLQRVFKIGFNRAARIVDQLEAAGVVGAEEGTKPRKILMSLSEFENYIKEAM